MISIGIKSDVDKVAQAFDKMAQGQIKYATSLTINRLAKMASADLKATMARVFDRPKSYTLNSLYVKNSTKTDLVARVGHKDQGTRGTPAGQYLQAEIEGGVRAQTPFEKLLNQYAHASGSLVPTRQARLDSFGGVTKAVRMAIIKATKGRSGSDPRGVFVIPVGANSHLAPGVYQRMPNRVKIKHKNGVATATGGGTRLKTIMLFKDKASYRPIYDLVGTVNQAISNNFAREFAAAMDEALSSAKLKL